MPHQHDWLRPTDLAVLEYLSERRPDYVALIASYRGLNLEYAQRRVEVLAEAGLVEPVSQEVVYRVTEAGERALARTTAATDVSTAAGDD